MNRHSHPIACRSIIHYTAIMSGIDVSTRYDKQMLFEPVGLEGQRRLRRASALVVGVGGLGSWSCDLLTRSGIGRLRIVDDDVVEISNIHRQCLYGSNDAECRLPKVEAAKRRLNEVNDQVDIETAMCRLDASNVQGLADGMDIIIDGTDNFPTRFIINDFAVLNRIPWVFAGVVQAQGQIMSIPPGGSPCLRCIQDEPPGPCIDPQCRTAGVLGPAVAIMGAMQALEAIKLITSAQTSPYLIKFNLWINQIQKIDASAAARDNNCPCCKQRIFDYI